MLCIRTQAFLGLDKNKESLNTHGHFEAVLWQVVLLPCPLEVEQRSAKAKPFIACILIPTRGLVVKARDSKVSWEESPRVGSTSEDPSN